MNNKINYEIDNCITDLDTLIALDKRAIRDLENNTHEIEQYEVLTIIREFIRLRNDYKQEKEKNKELAEALAEWINGKRIYFNHISRDTIKQKIKEIYNRRIEDGECELALHGFQREAKIDVLKKLLEE